MEIKYDIKLFNWDKDTNTLSAYMNDLWVDPWYWYYPFPNGGKQFFIENPKTRGFRRFRLYKENNEMYLFKSEDDIHCIVYKFKTEPKLSKGFIIISNTHNILCIHIPYEIKSYTISYSTYRLCYRL